MSRRLLTFLSVLILLLPLAGCGIYSFSGAVPTHLQTVAIPIFENQTAEFGLDQEMTDEVVNTFTIDNTLKIVDLRNADSALYGTIARVDDQPSTYSADESVQEYRVTIVVRVRYEDLTNGKVVWEQTISNFDNYDPGDPADREAAVGEAMRKITEDILNKTVSGW